MKKAFALFLIIACYLCYAQESPRILKTKFSKEALAQKIVTPEGKILSIGQVLNKHKGKIIVLDIWAGWCQDCIKAFPKAKELETRNPNIHFLFFSLDRTKENFARSLEKFNMKGKENYWFSEGWKNKFNNYIDLNWIPRYLVIDQKTDIAHYYAITPDDPELQRTLDRLTQK
ncbi:TlpA family protein disulfide reductase [Elizabethkingia argentiflava]|uniref:TlpA family protein disulfide reductase n=1 Tax=Elizabethkingia argenteiflava TaxID=2681556 RepID=A0A845PX81_9FLAO|nr:thioredoxin family protein [Elizabethkingia argenteiflava]NAW51077.1 TlpA family protein disulfide reductase [Elizabethkingia argenteiflava]